MSIPRMSTPKMSIPKMSIPIMSTVAKCLIPLCLLFQNFCKKINKKAMLNKKINIKLKIMKS